MEHAMRGIGFFLAGVAAGWVMRASFGSLRNIAVGAVTASYEAVDKVRRFVAEEREFFEDLMAEGRARFEAGKARKSAPRAVPKAVA
jgi:hypothetical protein